MPSEPSVPGTKPQPLSPQTAALRGASLAFNKKSAPKPGVKPKPEISGALAAATKAGNGRQVALRTGDTDVDDQRLAYQNTGSSVRSYTSGGANGVQKVYPNQFSSPNGGNGNGNGLLYPNYTGGDKARSGNASLIAATLAASRSPSVSPNPTGQRERNLSAVELRRQSSFERKGRRSESAVGDGVERESIPPTKGLIGLFEQNDGAAGIEKRSFGRGAVESGVQGGIRKSAASPMSIRAQSPTPSLIERPKPEIKATKPSLAQNQRLPPRPEPQEPPPPRKKPVPPPSKPIPIPPSPRRLPKLNPEPVDDASSDESFVSASDTTTTYKPSFRATLTEQKRRPTPSTNNSLSSAQTIDSMANAIVASSLAASRSASPSKSSLQSQNSVYPPPPPPRRHHLFHAAKADSRTPSPVKQGMKTTMRKQRSKEEIDEGEKRRGRKNLMKKHPNKHHEGDRKRWRDSITERERKRYEAVWASNKGHLLPSLPPPSSSNRGNGEDDDEPPSTGPAAGVCSLVVKDVWSRSRLDDDVLEEVYELVDRKQVGWLAREEFVVGLWLIDQRLKGRKLPIRVSDSVWKSVGVLGGIKVRRVK